MPPQSRPEYTLHLFTSPVLQVDCVCFSLTGQVVIRHVVVWLDLSGDKSNDKSVCLLEPSVIAVKHLVASNCV